MEVQRKRIPNKLKRYRKLAGYSQKDVAAILGLKSTARISSWERGTKFPGILNLFSLEILYRTLPAELFCDLYRMQRIKVSAAEKAFKEQKEMNTSLNNS
jgi:transcriptional regulator with XRE-family HTH domain